MIQRYIPFETHWDPFGEIQQLQRAMNRLFTVTDHQSSAVFPRLNIYANGDEAIVTAEVPGVEKDQLEISVTGSTFTLSGSRKTPEAESGSRIHRLERFGGEFRRTLDLPFDIESDQVKASLRNGILQVRLPRAERDKPRKIQVEV